MAIKSIAFFLAASLLFASEAWARPTTQDEARNVAVHWLSLEEKPMGSPLGHEVKKVETFTDEAGDPTYYVVHLLPSGLIFLPADDQVEPIIGFVSDATSYDPSPTNPLGALVSRDIPGRVALVREKEASASQSAETAAPDSPMAKAQSKWARLAGAVSSCSEGAGAGSNCITPTDMRVAPFVQSHWDQACAGGGNPPCTSTDPDAYNYYTPPHKPGNDANYVCGCGATAEAQVMRYFQYPTAGIGVKPGTYSVAGGEPRTGHTLGGDDYGGPYDWENMPLTTSSSTPLAERQAIGRLTWDAGLAECTNYDTVAKGGSSTGWDYDPYSLTTFFQYSNAINGDNFGSNLSASDLYAMVNPNLHAKYPVILGIEGTSGGHAVVCDGYGYSVSTTMYHHLNMGWSGEDDCWYNLPTIDAVKNKELYTSIRECTYNIYTTGTGEIIAGRVTDYNGVPIPSAQITANPGGYRASTDLNGIYAIPKVPSSTYYTVTATHGDLPFHALPVTTGHSYKGAPTSGNLWQVDFVPKYVAFSSLRCAPTSYQCSQVYEDYCTEYFLIQGSGVACGPVGSRLAAQIYYFGGTELPCPGLATSVPSDCGEWGFLAGYGPPVTCSRRPDDPACTHWSFSGSCYAELGGGGPTCSTPSYAAEFIAYIEGPPDFLGSYTLFEHVYCSTAACKACCSSAPLPSTVPRQGN